MLTGQDLILKYSQYSSYLKQWMIANHSPPKITFGAIWPVKFILIKNKISNILPLQMQIFPFFYWLGLLCQCKFQRLISWTFISWHSMIKLLTQPHFSQNISAIIMYIFVLCLEFNMWHPKIHFIQNKFIIFIIDLFMAHLIITTTIYY